MRIALITIPRSGSSFFSRQLAKKHKVQHAGELFHYGALKNKLGYEFPTTIKDSIKIWTKGNCVAKIFTRDFIHFSDSDQDLEYYEDLIYGTADKIYYLFRKNTLEHLKSMITADFKDFYSPYKNFETVEITISQEKLQNQLDKILLDVERLKDISQRYPGETVYLEDFAKTENKYKYKSIFYNELGEEYPEDLNLKI